VRRPSRFSRFHVYHAFRIFTSFAYIARFAFSHFSHVSHSHVFRVFHAFVFQIPHVFCAFHISDSSRFHASHILHTFRDPTQFIIRTLAYLAGFTFPHILHSRVFRTLTCATARLPGIHRILFACPVLILQGPLVRISLCFTRITSYMSLHSHLCSLISLCVYITSPLYV